MEKTTEMVALKVLKYEIQVFVSPKKSDIDLFIVRKQDDVNQENLTYLEKGSFFKDSV